MRIKALSVGLALVVAAACTESATSPTALSDAPPAPTLDFINGPAMPGNSGIVRFEAQEWFVGIDVADELFSVIGLGDPLNDSFLCGGAPLDPEFMSWQEFFADDAYHQHINGTDVLIEIVGFDWTCGDPSIAIGTGDFKLVDNDLFVSGTRTNSFGWNAHGQLTDPVTGNPVNYSETWRAQINNNHGFRVLVEDIRLSYPGGS